MFQFFSLALVDLKMYNTLILFFFILALLLIIIFCLILIATQIKRLIADCKENHQLLVDCSSNLNDMITTNKQEEVSANNDILLGNVSPITTDTIIVSESVPENAIVNIENSKQVSTYDPPQFPPLDNTIWEDPSSTSPEVKEEKTQEDESSIIPVGEENKDTIIVSNDPDLPSENREMLPKEESENYNSMEKNTQQHNALDEELKSISLSLQNTTNQFRLQIENQDPTDNDTSLEELLSNLTSMDYEALLNYEKEQELSNQEERQQEYYSYDLLFNPSQFSLQPPSYIDLETKDVLSKNKQPIEQQDITFAEEQMLPSIPPRYLDIHTDIRDIKKIYNKYKNIDLASSQHNESSHSLVDHMDDSKKIDHNDISNNVSINPNKVVNVVLQPREQRYRNVHSLNLELHKKDNVSTQSNYNNRGLPKYRNIIDNFSKTQHDSDVESVDNPISKYKKYDSSLTTYLNNNKYSKIKTYPAKDNTTKSRVVLHKLSNQREKFAKPTQLYAPLHNHARYSVDKKRSNIF